MESIEVVCLCLSVDCGCGCICGTYRIVSLLVFPNPLSYSPIQQARFTRWENEVGETENKETEMGRRAKKVTGFQGPRSQERTGQTERGVYAKEGKKKKKKKGKKGGGALSDVVE